MPSVERIVLVERLVRENKSNKEIAEILGIKQNSVRSTIRKCGVERDKNKPCKICGKPVGTANPKAMYCKECGRKMKSEYARKSAQRNMVEVTCKYCGKKFFGHEAAKFCSKVCYQKAVSEGKYNKVEFQSTHPVRGGTERHAIPVLPDMGETPTSEKQDQKIPRTAKRSIFDC